MASIEPVLELPVTAKVERQGRITIPDSIRTALRIRVGDVVHVKIERIMDEPVGELPFTARVRSLWRITIPCHVREALGIEGCLVYAKIKRVECLEPGSKKHEA